jgi:hypothetical protein
MFGSLANKRAKAICIVFTLYVFMVVDFKGLAALLRVCFYGVSSIAKSKFKNKIDTLGSSFDLVVDNYLFVSMV